MHEQSMCCFWGKRIAFEIYTAPIHVENCKIHSEGYFVKRYVNRKLDQNDFELNLYVVIFLSI